MQKRLPTHAAQAQIEQLWQELAHDPQRQAEACAALCQEQAPHLAEWLKAKILAGIPDRELMALVRPPVTDGRILAYEALCDLIPTGKQTPDTAGSPPKPRRQPTKRPQRRGRARHSAFEATYRTIFGVYPRIVASAEELHLRSDPELGRLSAALRRAHQFRFWVVGRELNRQAGGSGCIAKAALKKQLAYYGIGCTDRHFRRILAAGEGVFWRPDRKHPDRLYLNAWKQVGVTVIRLAEERHIEIGFNRPGVREQHIDVSGSLEEWEGRLYAAWVAYRAGKHGLSISRARQAALFNRSEKTIRQWEKRHLRGVVTKRPDYEQHPDDRCTPDELYDRQYHIPDHAQVYSVTVGQRVVQRRYWRRPNRYFSTVEAHAHRGQARKVRKVVNGAMSADTEGGPWRTNYTAEQHRRRVRSHKFRRGEDGDVMQPVHVYIGRDSRSGTGVWELMIPDPAEPYPKTRPNERPCGML
jgi:hypothetical protein